MPSLLPGFEYDIFISYRHKDNKSDGWVTEFVRTLRSELEATFKEDISIYFDENPHDGLLQHHEVDDSLREKLRCLVFIPIVSQTYCDPKSFAWQHELLAFIKHATEDKLGLKTKVGGGNTASRVLPVRIHDVDAPDKKLFEEATGGIMRPIDFIYKESGVNRPLRPTDNRDRNQVQTDYRNQVNKVANAIKDIIAGLQGAEEIVSPEKGPEVTRGPVSFARDREAGRKWKMRLPRINSHLSFGFAVVALLALVALSVIHFSEPTTDHATYRSAILPPGPNLQSFALSPDGKSLVYSAVDSSGHSLLWVRPLNALVSRPLNGTENGYFPFWSPNSRSIGYVADGKLKRIEATGGASLVLCEWSGDGGASWNEKGTIILGTRSHGGALLRVSENGGSPIPIAEPETDSSSSKMIHLMPWFLPDGQHFLYLSRKNPWSDDPTDVICVGSLDSTFRPKVIARSGTKATYANGQVLFGKGNMLMAQPFDINQLQTTGEAMPIAENLRLVKVTGHISFSVSQNGLLVYRTDDGPAGRKLRWLDRDGKEVNVAIEYPIFSQDGTPSEMALSPNDTKIVATIADPTSGTRDLWQYEIGRRVWTRFTFNPGTETTPLWSPDGRSIVYASNEGGHWSLIQRSSNDDSNEKVLLQSDHNLYPDGWSPDGRFIAYSLTYLSGSADIWILPMSETSESKPFPFLQTRFKEELPVFSPDGRWIAYHSDESGRDEIFVRPFPGPGGKYQVSSSGGAVPRWRGDGKELFFLGLDNKIMATEIKLGETTIEIGATRELGGYAETRQFSVTADGKKFLVVSSSGKAQATPLTLVVNWPEEIKK